MHRSTQTQQKWEKTAFALVVGIVLLCVPPLVHATTIFTATLTGSQETPPVTTAASGFGTFVLNDARMDLSFNVDYAALTFMMPPSGWLDRLSEVLILQEPQVPLAHLREYGDPQISNR